MVFGGSFISDGVRFLSLLVEQYGETDYDAKLKLAQNSIKTKNQPSIGRAYQAYAHQRRKKESRLGRSLHILGL